MHKIEAYIYKLLLAVITFLILVISAGTFLNAQGQLFTGILSPMVLTVSFLFTCVVLCVFYIFTFKKIDRMGKKAVIITTVITGIIILILYGVLLMRFCPYTSSDALNVQDAAVYMAKTGTKTFELSSPHGEYMGKFSNNYFLTIVLAKIYIILFAAGIKNVYFPIFLLAVVSVLITTVFLYLTGILVGGAKSGAKVLIFCAGNPLYYILPMWLYTNVFSLPFTAGVVYFGMRIWKKEVLRDRVISSVCFAVCLVVGYYIRPTVIIPFIAFVLCSVLELFNKNENKKRKFIKLCQSMGIILIAGVALAHMINTENQAVFKNVSDRNFPITHWIMMASHGTGEHDMQDVLYTSSFTTKEAKQKATIEKAINNYKSYKPIKLLEFLEKKMQISWSYADGGDLMLKCSRDMKYTPLYSWIFGNRSDLFRLYCYAFRMVNLCFVFIGLWDILRKKQQDIVPLFYAVSLFGGICFYSIWEVKPSYAMPFVMFLLLLGSYGTDAWNKNNEIQNVVSLNIENSKRKFSKGRCVVIVLCIISICVTNTKELKEATITDAEWGIHCLKDRSVRKIQNKDNKMHIRQDFYMNKPFNRVSFFIGGKMTRKGEAVSQVAISDHNGRKIYGQKIKKAGFGRRKEYVINMPTIYPERNEKYTLSIKYVCTNPKEVYIYRRNEFYVKSYRGQAYINGQKENANLYLNVGHITRRKWCTEREAVLWNLFWGMLALTEVIIWKKDEYENV